MARGGFLKWEQTALAVDAYTLDIEGGRLIRAHGARWLRHAGNAVTITYMAGYDEATDVPEAINSGRAVASGGDVRRPGAGLGNALSTVADSLMWPFRRVAV